MNPLGALTEHMGPLPVWAWGGIGAVGIALGSKLLSGRKAPAQAGPIILQPNTGGGGGDILGVTTPGGDNGGGGGSVCGEAGCPVGLPPAATNPNPPGCITGHEIWCFVQPGNATPVYAPRDNDCASPMTEFGGGAGQIACPAVPTGIPGLYSEGGLGVAYLGDPAGAAFQQWFQQAVQGWTNQHGSPPPSGTPLSTLGGSANPPPGDSGGGSQSGYSSYGSPLTRLASAYGGGGISSPFGGGLQSGYNLQAVPMGFSGAPVPH